jgi:amino acid adenylation domain-containing protein
VVAVMARRSLDLLVALYGVLKSGAAYLPIDPDQPDERILYFLQDSDAKIVLFDAGAILPAEYRGEALEINQVANNTAPEEINDMVKPEDLAYVIYTSGSTGKPKGVLIEHRSIVNRLLWMMEEHGYAEDDIQIQKTPITFDVSVPELFLWSFVGGKLILPAPGAEKDPEALIESIEKNKITRIHFVPSMLNAFLEYIEAFGITTTDSLVSLKTVYCSGEALSVKTVRLFQKNIGNVRNIDLCNLYGPTEAAVEVSFFDCKKNEGRSSIPIGKPVWNTQLYILDKQLRPMPIGISGELFIGGIQVARGYLNKPELTTNAFIPDPFSKDKTAKLYRTGDLAKWLPDGDIEYLGRNDSQIKIRGIRIEPGEIEAVIREIEGVTGAVVIARQGRDGEKQLLAYFTRSQSSTSHPDTQEMLAALKERLPPQMVPFALVELDSFPLNSSGKLDRKQLPEPQGFPEPQADVAFEASSDPKEKTLTSIWSGLFGNRPISRTSNFLELGGHSLLAIRLLGLVRSKLGVSITLAELFQEPTYDAVLRKVQLRSQQLDHATILPRDPATPVPMSWGQRRMWFLQQIDDSGIGFNIAHAIRLEGKVDTDRMKSAIHHLVEKHEALRTVFEERNGEPFPKISSAKDFAGKILTFESRTESAYHETYQSILDEAWNQKFDLQTGPLFLARLVTFSGNVHLLTLAMHHIIADEPSGEIIVKELSQYLNHSESTYGSQPLQSGDYSVWEQLPETKERIETHWDWWRKKLSNSPVSLDLPTDFNHTEVLSFEGDRVEQSLSSETSVAIDKLLKKHEVTPFMFFLSAWAFYLGKRCNKDDIVIGAPVSLRDKPGLENTVGFLLNSLPFRLRIPDESSFGDFLASVRKDTLETYGHVDFPFDKLVGRMRKNQSQSMSPIFQVMLVMNGNPIREPNIENLECELLESYPKTAKFPLTLFVHSSENGYRLQMEYRSDLFLKKSVVSWMKDFSSLIGNFIRTPHKSLSEISYIHEENRQQLLDWGKPGSIDTPDGATVCDLFAKAFADNGTKIALQTGSGCLTYQELETCVGGWSHFLKTFHSNQ